MASNLKIGIPKANLNSKSRESSNLLSKDLFGSFIHVFNHSKKGGGVDYQLSLGQVPYRVMQSLNSSTSVLWGRDILTNRSHEMFYMCFKRSKSLLFTSLSPLFFEHRSLKCENLKSSLGTQFPEPQRQLPVIVCVSNCMWLSKAPWILGVREIMHRSAINTNGGLHAQILHTPRREQTLLIHT